MQTAIGKALKMLRIEQGEVLFDMAKRLGFSSSYLSAIEVGKRKVPEGLIEKIIIEYKLDNSWEVRLQNAKVLTESSIKLELNDVTPEQRNFALIFARNFESVDEETSRRIIALLEQHVRGEN